MSNEADTCRKNVLPKLVDLGVKYGCPRNFPDKPMTPQELLWEIRSVLDDRPA